MTRGEIVFGGVVERSTKIWIKVRDMIIRGLQKGKIYQVRLE